MAMNKVLQDNVHYYQCHGRAVGRSENTWGNVVILGLLNEKVCFYTCQHWGGLPPGTLVPRSLHGMSWPSKLAFNIRLQTNSVKK